MIDFGRRILHDPRSRRFAHPVQLPTKLLSVRHHMDASHVDQFYLGACVGFSGTNALNTRFAQRSRARFNQLVPIGKGGNTYLGNNDGIRNYSESTKRDPFPWTYPPEDGGSSAIGLMRWWQSIGVIDGYTWTFTFDAFLAALQMQPVLVGSNWFDDMMSTDENGLVTSSFPDQPGGHEYLATTLFWPSNPKRRLIGFEQSWGETPPDFRPRFYMSWDLAEELIINQQGDVVCPKFL